MARKSNVERGSKYRGLVKGMKKRWSATELVTLASKTLTVQQIVDHLKTVLDAIDATASSYAAWRDQVARQRAMEEQVRDLVRLLGDRIHTLYGDSATDLADFGMEPLKKTGPKTVTAKVAMVTKAAATRVERRTMGKRQKQRIKGKA
ncbi:MAG TPA: hypothetical protein VIF15_01300 [Polyangiaceae bacterium]|jgi:type I site-specific restriction endonuclease